MSSYNIFNSNLIGEFKVFYIYLQKSLDKPIGLRYNGKAR